MKQNLTLAIILRSLLFWLVAVIILIIYCGVTVVIMPFPARTRHRIVISATYCFNFLLQHLTGIKYTVSGLENIPDQPTIFVGNHQSAWETVVLNCFLPPSVWIMKKEILRIPFFGWVAKAIAMIAIDRNRGDDALLQVIKQGKRRFDMGFSIIAFPEGTRVKPKERKPFKYGSAKLALSIGVPLVPFAHNAGYCLPKRSFWLYPGTVSVIIGPAIYPDNDDPVAYTEKIEKWVYQQLEQIGS